MKLFRRRIKELEREIELLREVMACYKGDRDLYRRYYDHLQIAEGLLAEDQRMEYYKRLPEYEQENVSV